LYELVRGADVFLTNFLPEARSRLKIDADDLLAINPRLVYGRGSGYGPLGSEAQRGGFDGITYWHRTGISSSLTPHDADEVTNMPVPGFGDIQTSISLLAGVSAGLRQRDRTGQGLVVDVSLLSAGMWAMSMALTGANAIGQREMPKFGRADAPSPLANTYRTSDGRFVMLAILQSDQHWPRLCEVFDRPDLVDDPRFATHELRDQHARECIAELDKVFAQHDLAHWTTGLAQQDGQWESVATVGDLNDDEQAWANGYLQRVRHDDGREITLVSTPIQFDGEPGSMGQAPEHGGNTEEVLLELGIDWDRIMELKDEHVIN
jgi:crotonobetainyl-CoA:carnitine CoA-transferase CaiB-like acyl-CoA transferase